MRRPLDSPRKMIDLAIWSISQPAARAASAAVRVPSAISRMSGATPPASSAARTRFRLLLMAVFLPRRAGLGKALTAGAGNAIKEG